MRIGSRRSAFLPLLIAVVAATGLLGVPVSTPVVAAAAPDLTIVTAARYDVEPSKRRVAVSVDLTMTNRLRDTRTRRFYFDRAYLAVLPGTSAFRISGSGTKVSVARRTKEYTLLRIDMARLFSGKTRKHRLTFDLKDPGGAATRDIRVGTSLVSFPVWAYATDSTPGSSVTVVFPKGYTVDVETGQFPESTTDPRGRQVLRTGPLAKPLTFFAFLIADRPGAYEETKREATVGDRTVELTVRAWPDDEPWGKRVGQLIERALPVLGERIGLDWPRSGGLTVQEAVSRSTGGYAGLFDPTEGRVEVAYYAGDLTVLHEAAHAWFNGQLLADRWANEAFASHYAAEAATALKVAASGDALTDELKKAKIPLNAWGPLGRNEQATEDYAYAATFEVARLIAAKAGDEGLQTVWAAAAERLGAYQPPTGSSPAVRGATTGASTEAPELVTGPPDWRSLLDLLEDGTGESYEQLWRDWIVRPEDGPLLTERRAARAEYDAVVDAAEDWSLPRPIRDGLRAWRFDEVMTLLGEARGALDKRAEVAAAATRAGLIPGEALEIAFEGDDGFADSMAQAEVELETIGRYADAVAVRPAEPDLLQQLGLWGTTPEAEVERARVAYESGDLVTSADASGMAFATWSQATELGRSRLVSIAAITAAVLLGLLLIVAAIVSRHRRRRGRAALASAGSAPSSALPGAPDVAGAPGGAVVPATGVDPDAAETTRTPSV
jgi:hypothetical protein